MKLKKLNYLTSAALSSAVLMACGGGGDPTASDASADAGAAHMSPLQHGNAVGFTLGGSLSGLDSGKTLVLRNNGGSDLALAANGSFRFSGTVVNGDSYTVDVTTQPADQSCSVSNASGTVSGANVADIVVACSAAPASVSRVALSSTSTTVVSTTSTPNSALQSVTINNNLPYVYSGASLSVKLVTSAPCGAGGCSFTSYTNNSRLFPVPSAFVVAAGASESTTVMTVGSQTYATSASISAGSKSVSLDVYPALGAPAADGSYGMFGFGSSSRTGTGSVTQSMNRDMAIKNLDYQIVRYATRQCQTAIPGATLTRIGVPSLKGEYRNANGLLTYDATQNLRCAL